MIEVYMSFTDKGQNFLLPQKLIETFNEQNELGVHITSNYHCNNSTCLASVLNSDLKHIRDIQSNYDYAVFMHGDVNLDILSFFSHLINVGDKYDVIGLAGCKKVKTNQSPLNWFCASREDTDERYGRVIMNNNGRLVECFYNGKKHNEVTDTPVGMIDGLCIIFCKKAIESTLEFDEHIAPFDFYDSDISFQTLIDYKMRLGVIVERVYHESVGNSITSDEFLNSELIFRDKWKLDIPPGSRLEQIVKTTPMNN